MCVYTCTLCAVPAGGACFVCFCLKQRLLLLLQLLALESLFTLITQLNATSVEGAAATQEMQDDPDLALQTFGVFLCGREDALAEVRASPQ